MLAPMIPFWDDHHGPFSLLRSEKNRISPRYELINDEDKFEVSLHLPEYLTKSSQGDMNNIQVQILQDKILSIRGGTEEETDGRQMSTQFVQNFALDPATEIDKLTAHMKDGILRIMAPKDAKKVEESIRKIAIAVEEPTPLMDIPDDPAFVAADTTIGATPWSIVPTRPEDLHLPLHCRHYYRPCRACTMW